MKYLPCVLALIFTIDAQAIDWSDSSGFTSDLKDMVTRVKNKFNDINDNPGFTRTLEEAATEVRNTIEQNRPSGDFVSNCSGECARFRTDMASFFDDSENIINTIMTFGEPVTQDPVNFEIASSAIRSSPGPVLYPLYVAFNSSGLFSSVPTRLHNVSISLDDVREAYSTLPSKCDLMNDNRDRFKQSAARVSVAGLALKIIGKGLGAKGETNIMAKKKVAIHGYAGVIVEDNKKKKLGKLMDGIADALTASSAYLNRSIFQCEILQALQNHHTDVIERIDQHDEDVKLLLGEVVRLLLTPQGQRQSEMYGEFPLNPGSLHRPEVAAVTRSNSNTNDKNQSVSSVNGTSNVASVKPSAGHISALSLVVMGFYLACCRWRHRKNSG